MCHLGIDLDRFPGLDLAGELHGIERDGNDAAMRQLDAGNAAGLVHARQYPAAENVAIGIGVRQHGADADGERAARGGVGVMKGSLALACAVWKSGSRGDTI